MPKITPKSYEGTHLAGMKATPLEFRFRFLIHAILYLLGFDHTRLTYRYAGRDFRLTDVHGEIVRDILA